MESPKWSMLNIGKVLVVEVNPRANLRLTGRHGKWGQCLRHKTQEDLKEPAATTIGKRYVQERTELSLRSSLFQHPS